MKNKISLREGIRFHGHLGPWLVLGLLLGEYGLKKIGAAKYFGLEAQISGLHKRPRSCLIDGLQLSTGCTLGKANIRILKSKDIFVNFINIKTNKKIKVRLRDEILKTLESTKGHAPCEKLARKLYKNKPSNLFFVT